jgi:Superinfection immunity protein
MKLGRAFDAFVITFWSSLAPETCRAIGGLAILAFAAAAGFLTIHLALIIGVIALYFIPVIIASGRHHSTTAGIGALNPLLGWTLIGWIISLVWAFSAPRKTHLVY